MAITQSKSLLSIGSGLEIWEVALDEAREQDMNARVMPKEMMDRLAKTIAEDRRLESLPFLCLVDDPKSAGEKRLEIISGHHRVRASRMAKLLTCFAVVDVSGLTREEIASKQLAHNSIQGEDDRQVVGRIFDQIKNVELKLAAFIDPAAFGARLSTVSVGPLAVSVELRTVVLHFIPYAFERFEKTVGLLAERLVSEHDGQYIAELAVLDRLREAIRRTRDEYDVRSLGTVLDRMCGIVLEYLGEPDDIDDEMVPTRKVFGTTMLPKGIADELMGLAKTAMEEGLIPRKEPWKILEHLIQ